MKEKLNTSAQTALIRRSDQGRKTINYVKSKNNKRDVKVFYNFHIHSC